LPFVPRQGTIVMSNHGAHSSQPAMSVARAATSQAITTQIAAPTAPEREPLPPALLAIWDEKFADIFAAQAEARSKPPERQPLPPSPLTIWGEKFANIRATQAEVHSKPPLEFTKTLQKADVLPADADEDAELAWLKANAKEIKDDMVRYGAVVFRGFKLMKQQPGFETFYQAIGMDPCLDPLFSVATRPPAYGDDGELSDTDLKHLDEVTKKNSKYIKMNEGDVVLLDNYMTMHGRNVFDGTRKHAVAWFSGWDGEDKQRSRQWN